MRRQKSTYRPTNTEDTDCDPSPSTDGRDPLMPVTKGHGNSRPSEKTGDHAKYHARQASGEVEQAVAFWLHCKHVLLGIERGGL